jgi:hypothetical protein
MKLRDFTPGMLTSMERVTNALQGGYNDFAVVWRTEPPLGKFKMDHFGNMERRQRYRGITGLHSVCGLLA